MSEPAAELVYLEADDEVTAVARRLRALGGGRVVLVTPGRSRATSSVITLRLLQRVAEEEGIALAVVGDPLTRSLAAEAGLGTHRSVEDARASVEADDPSVRRATIHVVRSSDDASDETLAVPTVAGVHAARSDATVVRPALVADPATGPEPASGPARRARRGLAAPTAPLLAIAGLLVVGLGVAAALVLPAATIVIEPRAEPIGPIEYEVRIVDPDRARGTVEAQATVAATGTYDVETAAAGAVVLFNFNSNPVRVEAGTFVAAGEQAFGTDETIVVPAGTLTSDGRVRAGEGGVTVTAAAIGDAGNMPAGAIDTVVNESTAAALRGFANNTARLVENPEPTGGGADESGVEVTQEDVDLAVDRLTEELRALAAEAAGSDADDVTIDVDPDAAPEIPDLEELAGTRDTPELGIAGSLAYDRVSASRHEVMEEAAARLIDDPNVVADGQELVPGSETIAVGDARLEGDALIVAVTAEASVSAVVDRADIVRRVRGLDAEAAVSALDPVGEARVTLWPAWVETVPTTEWRIEIAVREAAEAP